MNQTRDCEAGLAMFMKMAPVAGVSEGIVAGLKAAYSGAASDTINEAALARRPMAEYLLPNERLLAYAARNPPPGSWYGQDENLF